MGEVYRKPEVSGKGGAQSLPADTIRGHATHAAAYREPPDPLPPFEVLAAQVAVPPRHKGPSILAFPADEPNK